MLQPADGPDTKGMTLSEAINSVESAISTLGTADQNKAASDAKAEAALAAKSAADKADADAEAAYNESLDVLIKVATEAKRSVVVITPVPAAA